MMNKTKAFLVELVQQITLQIHLPPFFWLIIELLSNLQILSLALLPLLNNVPVGQNRLSTAINQLLSYLEPFKIFDPFDSEAAVTVVLIICGAYFVGYFSTLAFMILSPQKPQKENNLRCKFLSLMTVLHSRLIFYFIHCFTVKAMNSDKDFCSSASSFACAALRIIFPVIFFILNVMTAGLQELFCYQIHQNTTSSYGIKNNLHNFTKFLHKLTVVILFYFFNPKSKIVIFFTIPFTLFDLFILHSRLPYYNLRMLRLSIACSTISAFSSGFTICLLFNVKEENLCLFIMSTAPLLVKISLMKLRKTLLSIFTLKSQNPFHIIHLPSLLENWTSHNAIFPLPNIVKNSTLYSLGFIGSSDMKRILEAEGGKDNVKIIYEIQKSAYSKVIEHITKMMQKSHHNELLPICLSQIYSQIFGDSFKALDIVNRIPEKNLSFAGKVSRGTILKNLAALSQDVNTKEVSILISVISHTGIKLESSKSASKSKLTTI